MSGELDELVRKLLMMQSDSPDAAAPIKKMNAGAGEKADMMMTSARKNDRAALEKLWLEDRCYSENSNLNPVGFSEAFRREQVRDCDCIQMCGADERENWNKITREMSEKGMHFGRG